MSARAKFPVGDIWIEHLPRAPRDRDFLAIGADARRFARDLSNFIKSESSPVSSLPTREDETPNG